MRSPSASGGWRRGFTGAGSEGTSWNVPVSDLVRDLRKALGLTQDAVANRSGGKLKREYVVKVETGVNQATTDQMRAGFAAAFGVDRDSLAAYLDGEFDLDGIVKVARGERRATRERLVERDFIPYPEREAAIAERGAGWLAETITALRWIGLSETRDMSGADKAYWVARGDDLDRILRGDVRPPAHRPPRQARKTAAKKHANR